MTIHIQRFVDKLAAAESRQLREVPLTIQEAKGLHQDITRLLLKLEEIHVQTQEIAKTYVDETIEIQVSGGGFKD